MKAQVKSRDPQSTRAYLRLHYLDWLRVIAIFMVFLFHAVHPFDYGEWEIKNVEQSEMITIILSILAIWGMPFFFLMAGAATWFALKRRTARQYLKERFNRLLIPFIIGTILLSPLEKYLEWANKVQRGVVNVSLQEFVTRPIQASNPLSLISPRWFGYGFHLWFLGFLFSFALITLPFFLWLQKEAGQRFVSWIAQLCHRRGGILLFTIPLGIAQCLLTPLFPAEHDWADFVFQMLFFALGFILFSDERYTRSIRRDWWILLSVGTVVLLGLVGMYLTGIPVLELSETPDTVQFYILQYLGSVIALCYSLTMLFIGMRFLDFTNRWLRYGQEAALPFFVLHQPVIIVIAFFVVQWNAGISLKLPIVVLSSFVISVGLYELIVRRIRLLRFVFGMKSQVPDRE
jgi:surface polysaccharide O-acyltransferase-like enzyme